MQLVRKNIIFIVCLIALFAILSKQYFSFEEFKKITYVCEFHFSLLKNSEGTPIGSPALRIRRYMDSKIPRNFKYRTSWDGQFFRIEIESYDKDEIRKWFDNNLKTFILEEESGVKDSFRFLHKDAYSNYLNDFESKNDSRLLVISKNEKNILDTFKCQSNQPKVVKKIILYFSLGVFFWLAMLIVRKCYEIGK